MAQPADYPLFDHWYRTLNWLLDRCDRMPKQTRFTVSGRMVNLALEVSELLIEAIYSRDRAEALQGVNLRLEKLRIFSRLCRDRQYLSPEQYRFIITEINKAGRMCGGWKKTSI